MVVIELVELDGLWYAIGGRLIQSNGPLREPDDILRPLNGVVERLDPCMEKWTRVADLPELAVRPAIVTLHGNIYVIGEKCCEICRYR